MSYTLQTTVAAEFADAVDATVEALENEGFGVLCDIDVQATLEEKLGVEFRRYRILGACNPALAHQAMAEEITLGALLPCNVIVYETDDGDVVVATVDPKQLVAVADNDGLTEIAADVRERFERVLDSVATGLGTVPDA